MWTSPVGSKRIDEQWLHLQFDTKQCKLSKYCVNNSVNSDIKCNNKCDNDSSDIVSIHKVFKTNYKQCLLSNTIEVVPPNTVFNPQQTLSLVNPKQFHRRRPRKQVLVHRNMSDIDEFQPTSVVNEVVVSHGETVETRVEELFQEEEDDDRPVQTVSLSSSANNSESEQDDSEVDEKTVEKVIEKLKKDKHNIYSQHKQRLYPELLELQNKESQLKKEIQELKCQQEQQTSQKKKRPSPSAKKRTQKDTSTEPLQKRKRPNTLPLPPPPPSASTAGTSMTAPARTILTILNTLAMVGTIRLDTYCQAYQGFMDLVDSKKIGKQLHIVLTQFLRVWHQALQTTCSTGDEGLLACLGSNVNDTCFMKSLTPGQAVITEDYLRSLMTPGVTGIPVPKSTCGLQSPTTTQDLGRTTMSSTCVGTPITHVNVGSSNVSSIDLERRLPGVVRQSLESFVPRELTDWQNTSVREGDVQYSCRTGDTSGRLMITLQLNKKTAAAKSPKSQWWAQADFRSTHITSDPETIRLAAELEKRILDEVYARSDRSLYHWSIQSTLSKPKWRGQ